MVDGVLQGGDCDCYAEYRTGTVRARVVDQEGGFSTLVIWESVQHLEQNGIFLTRYILVNLNCYGRATRRVFLNLRSALSTGKECRMSSSSIRKPAVSVARPLRIADMSYDEIVRMADELPPLPLESARKRAVILCKSILIPSLGQPMTLLTRLLATCLTPSTVGGMQRITADLI